jgi:hypothetical protein
LEILIISLNSDFKEKSVNEGGLVVEKPTTLNEWKVKKICQLEDNRRDHHESP